MEIERATPAVKKELGIFLTYVGVSVGFGFSCYAILYFVFVSLILPALGTAGALLAFWPSVVSVLFVVEAAIAFAIFRPLKTKAVSGGILSASLVCMLLLMASPILFVDVAVRSSLLNLTVLLLAPFMGLTTGGVFVSRRVVAKN